MTKKIISMCAMFTILFSLFVMPVYAQEPENSYPEIVNEIANETGDKIVVLQPGLYEIGDHVVIDVTDYHVGEGDLLPTTRGASPPGTSASDCHDWSQGSYSGSFTYSERIWTNKRFTGYSSYTCKATNSGSPIIDNSGKFSMAIYNERNRSVASVACQSTKTYTFTGLTAGTKYCFALTRSYDEYTSSGKITISLP